MIGPKKSHSKYTDLGITMKSPERNCRSFQRNISSFEKIGKESGGPYSPDSVTMVAQKMKHLLHLDDSPPSASEIVETKVRREAIVHELAVVLSYVLGSDLNLAFKVLNGSF